jgi:hypothetical protein
MVRLTLTVALFLSFLTSFHGKIDASDSNLSKAWQLFSMGEDPYTENRFDLALRYYLAALDLSPSMSKEISQYISTIHQLAWRIKSILSLFCIDRVKSIS